MSVAKALVDLFPEQIAIGEMIEKEFLFLKYKGVFNEMFADGEAWRGQLDANKFSHVKRVHVAHYLFYSQEMKYFTIAVKFDNPKGLPAGGIKYWDSIMIPRLINNVDDAREFLTGMLERK